MQENTKLTILHENRKRLIYDINILSSEIRKLKNQLIKVKTNLQERIMTFGNYCVQHLQYNDFDVHFATKVIESVKRLRKDCDTLERLISYKERNLEKLNENLKGLNDYLCLR